MTREEKVKLYDSILEVHPECIRKGKNNPYTSMNGHMFSMVTKEGQVAIRMSKDVRAKYMEEVNPEEVVTYNTMMKEYIEISDEMLNDQEAVLSLLDQSIEYIKTLRPK
ncbi:MAG: hypothetical protein HKN68_07450 [Saprospiraceae bacterium]|nr:hypothetical protein [Saprospiraceae bacterium]